MRSEDFTRCMSQNSSTVNLNAADLFATNITYETQGIRFNALEPLSVQNMNSIHDSRQ